MSCRCCVPWSMNRCIGCSLSNQFGDGELDMSAQLNAYSNAPALHMGPTIPLAPSSEIDDIFARKAKTTILQTDQHSSSDLKQKKRKKKRSETQTPAPEIVLDPSTQQSLAPKTTRHDRSVPPKKKRKVVETKLDQVKFRDSRGTGPRKRVLCHEPRLALNHLQAAKPTKGLRYIKRVSLGLMQRLEVSFNRSNCEVNSHLLRNTIMSFRL
jgi:hypothetical protein